jgi:hypothetical protein
MANKLSPTIMMQTLCTHGISSGYQGRVFLQAHDQDESIKSLSITSDRTAVVVSIHLIAMQQAQSKECERSRFLKINFSQLQQNLKNTHSNISDRKPTNIIPTLTCISYTCNSATSPTPPKIATTSPHLPPAALQRALGLPTTGASLPESRGLQHTQVVDELLARPLQSV